MKTEFEDQRDRLWQRIDTLMATRQLTQLQQARRLLSEWLTQHPDDYYSLDGGEELARMEGALEIIEEEKAAELVAA